jgi:hypothetical protein
MLLNVDAEMSAVVMGCEPVLLLVEMPPARTEGAATPRMRPVPKASVSENLFMSLDLPGLIIAGSPVESHFERVDP